MSDLQKLTSEVINKANDFKYFLLFGTLILYIDCISIISTNTSIININTDYISKDLSVGLFLILILSFYLYISFFVIFIKTLIMVFITSLPEKFHNWWNKRNSYPVDLNIWIHSSDLKRYAVLNDNAVAYSLYLNWKKETSINLLELYALAFLIISSISIFLSKTHNETVFNYLYGLIENPTFPFMKIILFSIIYIFFCSIFYIGIIRGCGLNRNEFSNYIRLEDHGIVIKPNN